MTYITKTHSLIVLPEGDPMFSEMATIIGVDDDSGGPYITVMQYDGKTQDKNKIKIDQREWPHIRGAVERMIEEWEGKDGQ